MLRRWGKRRRWRRRRKRRKGRTRPIRYTRGTRGTCHIAASTCIDKLGKEGGKVKASPACSIARIVLFCIAFPTRCCGVLARISRRHCRHQCCLPCRFPRCQCRCQSLRRVTVTTIGTCLPFCCPSNCSPCCLPHCPPSRFFFCSGCFLGLLYLRRVLRFRRFGHRSRILSGCHIGGQYVRGYTRGYFSGGNS